MAKKPETSIKAQELANAADVLMREAKRFEALSAAARSFTDAATALNQVEEAEKTLAGLNGDLAEARQAKALVAAECESMRKKANEAVESAMALAAQLEQQAKVTVENMKAAADEECKRGTDAVKVKAREILAEAMAKKDKVEAEINKLTEEEKTLQDSIAAKSKELFSIEARLQEVRAKVKELIAD